MIDYLNTITTIEVNAQITTFEHTHVQLMQIATVGVQGAKGDKGEKGEKGEDGGGGSTYEQDLTGVSSQLQVEHNTDKLISSAKVIDDNGEVIDVHVVNRDAQGNFSKNSALVISSLPMAGKLILN